MRTTQKIFGLARPASAVTWEDMLPLMQLEAAHVWSLYERDVLRDAWMRTDALGAVYVLESAPTEAGRVLAAQPIARHGLVEFEVVPVGPFTPLTRLFGTQRRPIPPASPLARGGSAATRVLTLEHLRPGVSADDLAPYLAREATYTWSLWKAGIIREHYVRTDRAGAALVLEVAGITGAHALLSERPLVRAGLIEFECLSVTTFTGFDALFDGCLDEAPEPLPDPTATSLQEILS